MTLTFGSLFAGIGGFDLGFERAGMECRWQVEIDPYAQKVLNKHWPNVGQWDDVRTFPPTPAKDWKVDVICGGFPCQDISTAGKRAGIDGERSGLFFEIIRIYSCIQPRFLILENVAALLVRGMDAVLLSLAEVGLNVEWHCIPASHFGLPHRRDRVFLIAHRPGRKRHAPNTKRYRAGRKTQGGFTVISGEVPQWMEERRDAGLRLGGHTDAEPDVDRVADGIPDQMDRLRGLGNAVVPQVAEWIGRRIVESLSPKT